MAYCTIAQITAAAGGADELVQLADQDHDGVADAAVIAQAQAEVDAMIDGYVATRFATPLDAPSRALQACAAAEVVYWLRSKKPGLVSDDQRRDHQERLELLGKVSKGHFVPVDASGAAPAPGVASRSAWVERTEDPETGRLTRTSWKGLY